MPASAGVFTDVDTTIAERDFGSFPCRALVEPVEIRLVVGNPFFQRHRKKWSSLVRAKGVAWRSRGVRRGYPNGGRFRRIGGVRIYLEISPLL